MASCEARRVGGAFLREVMGLVGLVLFPFFSFALRLQQVIMRSRSIILLSRWTHRWPLCEEGRVRGNF